MRRLALSVLLTLLACDGAPPTKVTKAEPAAKPTVATPSAAPQVDPADAEPAPEQTCPAADSVRVDLETEDGVALIADHYSAGKVGARGVVLLHMIPPHHTLDNFPREFIDPLVAAGFDVINVNRRGAPGSGGEAEDAYKGAKGKLDALAGVEFLLRSPCRVNPEAIAIVGASNGTTSMVDYAVHAHASQDPAAPAPAALVFLSGGGYTEAQNPLSKHLDALQDMPAFFAYPRKEAEWNERIATLAKDRGLDAWSFHVYEPGGHGTKLFDTDPALIPALVAWLDQRVPR